MTDSCIHKVAVAEMGNRNRSVPEGYFEIPERQRISMALETCPGGSEMYCQRDPCEVPTQSEGGVAVIGVA